MGTEGDSFYVVFADPCNAVAALVQGQRELATTEWPGGEQIRVRMGAHSGEPLIYEEAYVGMDVHRAARIGRQCVGVGPDGPKVPLSEGFRPCRSRSFSAEVGLRNTIDTVPSQPKKQEPQS